jgi:hypothetical protein
MSVAGPLPWGELVLQPPAALSQHDQLAEAIFRSQNLPEKPFPAR